MQDSLPRRKYPPPHTPSWESFDITGYGNHWFSSSFPPQAWDPLESRNCVLWNSFYLMGYLASSRCSRTIYYPNTQMNVLKIKRVGSISSVNFFACHFLKTRKTPIYLTSVSKQKKSLWGHGNEGVLPLHCTSVSCLWIDTFDRLYYWCCCYYHESWFLFERKYM